MSSRRSRSARHPDRHHAQAVVTDPRGSGRRRSRPASSRLVEATTRTSTSTRRGRRRARRSAPAARARSCPGSRAACRRPRRGTACRHAPARRCRPCAAPPSIAGLGAEQLDLEPLGPHRRAIDRDERPRARGASAHAAGAPTTSLPEPGAPVISTRLPVGATRSICWRSWSIAGEAPTRSISPPARSFSSSFSRRSRAASMARVDDQQQPVGLERLFDEIVGADLDRRDRGLDRCRGR